MLMRFVCALGLSVLALAGAAAAQELVKPADAREAQQQEGYVLLSAKVKKMSEIQDLLIQQQQLLLQQLEALRRDIDQLHCASTNLATRSDLAECVGRLGQIEFGLRRAQETNYQAICALVEGMLAPASAPGPGASGTNRTLKAEPYIVQSGDTLLKIIGRMNDVLAKGGLPELTADQIVRANPGLNPDRIRIGQMLLIPVGEGR
jgi:TolA-binding protein